MVSNIFLRPNIILCSLFKFRRVILGVKSLNPLSIREQDFHPRPIILESSAFTTRQRLFDFYLNCSTLHKPNLIVEKVAPNWPFEFSFLVRNLMLMPLAPVFLSSTYSLCLWRHWSKLAPVFFSPVISLCILFIVRHVTLGAKSWHPFYMRWRIICLHH